MYIEPTERQQSEYNANLAMYQSPACQAESARMRAISEAAIADRKSQWPVYVPDDAVRFVRYGPEPDDGSYWIFGPDWAKVETGFATLEEADSYARARGWTVYSVRWEPESRLVELCPHGTEYERNVAFVDTALWG